MPPLSFFLVHFFNRRIQQPNRESQTGKPQAETSSASETYTHTHTHTLHRIADACTADLTCVNLFAPLRSYFSHRCTFTLAFDLSMSSQACTTGAIPVRIPNTSCLLPVRFGVSVHMYLGTPFQELTLFLSFAFRESIPQRLAESDQTGEKKVQEQNPYLRVAPKLVRIFFISFASLSLSPASTPPASPFFLRSFWAAAAALLAPPPTERLPPALVGVG